MSEAAAPGRVLNDRYRLVERLASGGMATVWVAEDTLLARRVAVKTLHPELAVDEGVRARFRNEAISAAGLAHPGIVTTYDTGEDQGTAYIVMELVNGPNLRVLLDQRGALPQLEALRIARGVAAALEVAHQRGIVHRDVKPANVLVPSEGPVKVTDFGIAKASGSGDLTGSGTILGTARYLAPEQVRGEAADGRADVYAVGLLLHEMLTGSQPFHGDTEMQTALARLSVAPDPLPATVSPEVRGIVARCLAVSPDDRWPSAHALAAALDTAMRGAALPHSADATAATPTPRPDVPVAVTPEPSPPQPRRQKSSWAWALLGAVILGVGAAGGYLLVQHLTKDSGGGGGGGGTAPVIVSANDFDPLGGDGEHHADVPLAIDGDETTAWTTETYSSQSLGGKAGVGIYVVLDGVADVSSVEVITAEAGWRGAVYVSDSPASSLDGWGSPVTTDQDLSTATVFHLDPARRGGAVLLWITQVPESGELSVLEVRVA